LKYGKTSAGVDDSNSPTNLRPPREPDDWYRVVTWDTYKDARFETLEQAQHYIAKNAPESTEWHIEHPKPRPKPEPVWTLVAPDGRRFTGSTPLRAAKAEMDSRLTPEQQLANLMAAVEAEAMPRALQPVAWRWKDSQWGGWNYATRREWIAPDVDAEPLYLTGDA
jgi:hypothetical protein